MILLFLIKLLELLLLLV